MHLNGNDLAHLSMSERILLVQELWDSVLEQAETMPITPSESRWLEERVSYADRLDAEWFSFDQILAARSGR